VARTNITKRQIRFPISSANRDLLFNKLAEHDAALDSMSGDGTAASLEETVVAAGPLNPNILITNLSVTGTVAYTLAAGTKIGQRKLIRQVVAATSPSGTIAGTFKSGATTGTSLGIWDALTDTAEIFWNGTQWTVGASVGVAVT